MLGKSFLTLSNLPQILLSLSSYSFTKEGYLMKITLTKEQTIKFLMCFVEDARRIAQERKKQSENQKGSA